jgi:hypothetical protein
MAEDGSIYLDGGLVRLQTRYIEYILTGFSCCSAESLEQLTRVAPRHVGLLELLYSFAALRCISSTPVVLEFDKHGPIACHSLTPLRPCPGGY